MMGAFGASARAKRSTAASLCGGGTVEGTSRPRAAGGRPVVRDGRCPDGLQLGREGRIL